MFRHTILTLALIALCAGDAALAKPRKQGPDGQNCIKTGTERREGKDADTGEKLDCLWDFCTTCKKVGKKIDCDTLVTSYSNPRDCKPVHASRPIFRFQLRRPPQRLMQ